jgi:hypothetical protein
MSHAPVEAAKSTSTAVGVEDDDFDVQVDAEQGRQARWFAPVRVGLRPRHFSYRAVQGCCGPHSAVNERQRSKDE